ncbi:MAG TPA: DMT family transporter [Chitinophagales bacterium]|nr:DMT family transporter [Chitinophagales bacterium]
MEEKIGAENSITTPTKNKITFYDWLIFAGLSTIWGFSFFFIKKGLSVFSPLEVAALRMSIAFFAFIPLIIINLKSLSLPKEKLVFVPLLGLFGNLIPSIMFCIAGTKIDSALSGIMNSTTPLFALTIGSLLFGISLTKNKILGVAIGFIGTLIIILSKQSITSINPYILLPLLATICYGLNANIYKHHFQQEHPIRVALLQYAFVAFFSILYLIFSGGFAKIIAQPTVSWQALKYLLLLGVLGTALAQVYFNILAQRTTALFATMTTYVIPMVSIIIGIFIGEEILFLHIFGLMVILIGIYIGSRG